MIKWCDAINLPQITTNKFLIICKRFMITDEKILWQLNFGVNKLLSITDYITDM